MIHPMIYSYHIPITHEISPPPVECFVLPPDACAAVNNHRTWRFLAKSSKMGAVPSSHVWLPKGRKEWEMAWFRQVLTAHDKNQGSVNPTSAENLLFRSWPDTLLLWNPRVLQDRSLSDQVLSFKLLVVELAPPKLSWWYHFSDIDLSHLQLLVAE